MHASTRDDRAGGAARGRLGREPSGDGRRRRAVHRHVSGFEETPTLSVPGTGTIRVELSGDGKTISYRLGYSGLTGPALFAHIHLGRPAIAGGVIAFLCDSADTAPDGVTVPACPGAGGQVSGTIQASDVIGPAGQGIAAGEFDELVAALRAKATYANVHTEAFSSGEIRGRIR